MTIFEQLTKDLNEAETTLMFQFLTSHYNRALLCTNASPAYQMDRFINEWFGVDHLAEGQLRAADHFKSFYLAMCAGQIAMATVELKKLMDEYDYRTPANDTPAHIAHCALASHFLRHLGTALSFLTKDWMAGEVHWLDLKNNKHVVEAGLDVGDVFDVLQMGYGLSSDDNFTRARLIVAARNYRKKDFEHRSSSRFSPKDLGIEATMEFLLDMFQPYTKEERDKFMKDFQDDERNRSEKPPTVEEAIHAQASTEQAPANVQAQTDVQPAKEEEGEDPFFKQGNRPDGEEPLVTKFNG